MDAIDISSVIPKNWKSQVIRVQDNFGMDYYYYIKIEFAGIVAERNYKPNRFNGTLEFAKVIDSCIDEIDCKLGIMPKTTPIK